MWKSPSTTIGAILALALGIGATTTIFGLLSAVLLRPLPYPEADRLVEIWGNVQRQVLERRGASVPDFYDWRDQTTSFDAMAAWSNGSFIAYGGSEPSLVNSEIVDGPYFELLGVQPMQGRLFQEADFRRGAPPVVVIGERLSEQRFKRSGDAIGRALQLDSRVYTVIGVVAASFAGRSDQAELWTPFAATFPPGFLDARGSRSFPVLSRIKASVTLEAAQADIAAVSARLEQAYRDTNDKRSAEVSPLAAEVFTTLRPAVQLLFGAVALVLLIACCNVAGLLLARSESRRREMALRARARRRRQAARAAASCRERASRVVRRYDWLAAGAVDRGRAAGDQPDSAPELRAAGPRLAHDHVRHLRRSPHDGGNWADAAGDVRQGVARAGPARRRRRLARRRARQPAPLHHRRRDRGCGRTARGRRAPRTQLCGAPRIRSGVRPQGCADAARAVAAAARRIDGAPRRAASVASPRNAARASRRPEREPHLVHPAGR